MLMVVDVTVEEQPGTEVVYQLLPFLRYVWYVQVGEYVGKANFKKN